MYPLGLDFFANVIFHTSNTLLWIWPFLFLEMSQQLFICLTMYFCILTNLTVRWSTSIYLPWSVKRNWPQSIFETMSFWFFVLIAAWRSWECLKNVLRTSQLQVSDDAVSDDIVTDNDELSDDSLLWFGQTNERLNNFDVRIFIFKIVPFSAIQCYTMPSSSN